jgi:hypothetical protein
MVYYFNKEEFPMALSKQIITQESAIKPLIVVVHPGVDTAGLSDKYKEIHLPDRFGQKYIYDCSLLPEYKKTGGHIRTARTILFGDFNLPVSSYTGGNRAVLDGKENQRILYQKSCHMSTEIGTITAKYPGAIILIDYNRDTQKMLHDIEGGVSKNKKILVVCATQAQMCLLFNKDNKMYNRILLGNGQKLDDALIQAGYTLTPSTQKEKKDAVAFANLKEQKIYELYPYLEQGLGALANHAAPIASR